MFGNIFSHVKDAIEEKEAVNPVTGLLPTQSSELVNVSGIPQSDIPTKEHVDQLASQLPLYQFMLYIEIRLISHKNETEGFISKGKHRTSSAVNYRMSISHFVQQMKEHRLDKGVKASYANEAGEICSWPTKQGTFEPLATIKDPDSGRDRNLLDYTLTALEEAGCIHLHRPTGKGFVNIIPMDKHDPNYSKKRNARAKVEKPKLSMSVSTADVLDMAVKYKANHS